MRGMMSVIIRPRIRWLFLAVKRDMEVGELAEAPARLTNPSVPCTTGAGGLGPGLGLTERSQFWVKWFWVWWLVTGHRRVRRPKRSGEAFKCLCHGLRRA